MWFQCVFLHLQNISPLLPPDHKRVKDSTVASIIKTCTPSWSRCTSVASRRPFCNGRSQPKWTQGLSCVPNSILLSLWPIAITHQMASLFSIRKGAQVCDQLELQSNFQVQIEKKKNQHFDLYYTSKRLQRWKVLYIPCLVWLLKTIKYGPLFVFGFSFQLNIFKHLRSQMCECEYAVQD